MTQSIQPFADGDRVSHEIMGLGTVRLDPARDDLVVSACEAGKTGAGMVYVVWDDDRYPIAKIPADELERLPPGAAAISSGI